jgi:hypothetical protein
MPQLTHPRQGLELDWLGVDLRGHVGLFSSGGYGPIPKAVADHLTEVDAALNRLNMLPVLGPCAESPEGDWDYSSWIEPARRGIFGFDWGPTKNPPYARLTVPLAPVSINDIADPALKAAALLVRLPVDFQETTSIDADEMGVALNS